MAAPDHLLAIIESFAARRVLVLGDLILDRYWWGEASRLSPEAPVPVVRKSGATARPGGAANTAANLAALGAAVQLCGVTGDDRESAELRGVLSQCGIGTDLLLAEEGRPTTTKTRVIATHQQIVRVDEEHTAPVADAITDRAMASLADPIGSVDAVVVSDYAKGFLTARLLSRAIAAARSARVPVFVDPKGADAARYAGAALLKPNRLELSVLTGMAVRNHDETVLAASRLSSQMPETEIIVTEGAEGMTRFRGGAACEQVRSAPRQVFDVTGAGDTVLAVLAMSVASGAAYRDAMELAARAAAVAIGQMGTATVSASQLRETLA